MRLDLTNKKDYRLYMSVWKYIIDNIGTYRKEILENIDIKCGTLDWVLGDLKTRNIIEIRPSYHDHDAVPPTAKRIYITEVGRKQYEILVKTSCDCKPALQYSVCIDDLERKLRGIGVDIESFALKYHALISGGIYDIYTKLDAFRTDMNKQGAVEVVNCLDNIKGELESELAELLEHMNTLNYLGKVTKYKILIAEGIKVLDGFPDEEV